MDCIIPEEIEIPPLIMQLIVDQAVRRIIATSAWQRTCQFTALSVDGSKVNLSNEIFEFEFGSQQRVDVRFRKLVERNGKTLSKRATLEEITENMNWANDVLTDLKRWVEIESDDKEALSRGLKVEKTEGNFPINLLRTFENRNVHKPRLSLPVDLKNISVINWRDGTVDFTERNAVIRLNHACFDIGDQAQRMGFNAPVAFTRRNVVSHEDSLLAAIDGRAIILPEEDADTLLDTLYKGKKEIHAEESSPETILKLVSDNPGISKMEVKNRYYPKMTKRKFLFLWASAADIDPTISRPGRKSNQ